MAFFASWRELFFVFLYVKNLKEKRQIYQDLQEKLLTSGESQISLTDPDSRFMRDEHKGRDVCYNVQVAIDQKHKLIAEFEVTSDLNDVNQLLPMATKVKQTCNLEQVEVIADAGYFNKDAIKQCADQQIFCYIPEPQKSKNNQKGMYTDKDFCYHAASDIYTCPAGHTLSRTSCCNRHERKEYIYKTSACKTCSQKALCTTFREGRKIYRWERKKKKHPVELFISGIYEINIAWVLLIRAES